MDWDSQFLKGLYFVSHLLTLISLFVGFIISLNKNKNLTAFRINFFFQKVFRFSIILIVLYVISFSWKYIYTLPIWMFKGNTGSLYWEDGFAILYIIAYLFSVTILLPISWVLSSCIWQSSLNPAIEFINLLLPKSKLLTIQKPLLQIDKAIYATSENEVDVTNILRKMISDNKLIIQASNEIAGDPHPGVVKKLTVQYKYGKESKTETITEGETIELPNKLG